MCEIVDYIAVYRYFHNKTYLICCIGLVDIRTHGDKPSSSAGEAGFRLMLGTN